MAPSALALTSPAVTVKLADVAPAAIVTDAGTPAAAFMFVRSIWTPPAGALPEIVTFPVEVWHGPLMVAGESVSPVRCGGTTVSVAEAVAA